MAEPFGPDTLFKVLGRDGRACNGGTGYWSLPKGSRPGAWMPRLDAELVACQHGYHLARGSQVLDWLNARLFIAETRGELLEAGDKIVVREARLVRECPWDDRVARLFAADCAEAVLHIFEAERPDDDRPRKAIETVRAYAWAAARAAAGAAAGAAARAAAWAAAGDAAGAAARAAARAAAGAAAGDAAGDAARAAAGDAAGAAARAAAWAAARAAARAAAGDAAGAAARAALFGRLCWYLNGEAA